MKTFCEFPCIPQCAKKNRSPHSFKSRILFSKSFTPRQWAYKEWNHLEFPITEQIHEEVLSLPISPVMSGD